jgi:hypothetical protein
VRRCSGTTTIGSASGTRGRPEARLRRCVERSEGADRGQHEEDGGRSRGIARPGLDRADSSRRRGDARRVGGLRDRAQEAPGSASCGLSTSERAVQGGRRPIGRRPRRPSFIGARRYSLRDGSLRVCVHGVRAPVRGAAPNVRDRHRGALPLMRRGARATPVHLLGGPPRWRLAIRRWRLRLRPRLRLQLGGSPPSRSNRSSSASRSGSTECFLERPLRYSGGHS